MNSIKTRLILSFSLLILIITLVIGMISIAIGYFSLKKEAEASLELLASGGAKLTESRMEKIVSTLNLIAQKTEIQNMGWGVDLDEMKEELVKTDFIDIGYVMQNGYAYYTDGTIRLMSDRNYISEALMGNARISDVIISRVTRKPEIEVAVPVQLEGSTVGALVGRMEADSLSEITRDIGYGKQGYAFMVNSEGTVIAHPEADMVTKRYNPIKASQDNTKLQGIAAAISKIIRTKNGTVSFREQKHTLYAGFSVIEGTDWSFIITADQQEVVAAIPKMIRIIAVAVFVVFLISLGMVFMLDHRLTKPLGELTEHSKRIGELDIREDILEKHLLQKDEIGILANAFQTLTLNLRLIIQEIKLSANEVSDTSLKLTSISQETASVSEQISCNVEEISRGAFEQAGLTEAGLSQATLLSQKIEINHQHMVNLNTITGNVMDLIKEGLKDMEELIAFTEDNNSATQGACNIMEKMKGSSSQIGEASKIITSMARQTNLVALNASIEAARAGDAGLGFAVVAEEIQSMAEQSANSARYIGEIISELQSNIALVVESMNGILTASDKQHQRVSNTSQKYLNISEAMGKSERAVQELNASESEMEKANNEIKGMLQSLSAIAEQNASGTQQAVASMEEQAASVQAVAEVCTQLNDLAESLRTTITRLKV